MLDFDLNSEEIDKELQIDDSSVAALVLELKSNTRKAAKFQRFASAANKTVSELNLQLEILVAQIVDEGVAKSGSGAASLRQELRKTAARDTRYQELKRKIFDAEETASILNGLVNAWTARGFRLKEIVSITDRALYDAPRVFVKDLQRESDRVAKDLFNGEGHR